MLTNWRSGWSVERSRDWVARVNRPPDRIGIGVTPVSVQRGRPFGKEDWVRRVAKRFGMESSLRPRGWPKRSWHKDVRPLFLYSMIKINLMISAIGLATNPG